MAALGDENDPTTEGGGMPVSPVVPPCEPVSRWSPLMPPQDGYRAEDLDRIPDLPPHTELIDGSLVIVSPQKRFHMHMLRLLETQLLEQAPEGLEVIREMTVVLGERQRPEPDLMLIDARTEYGMDATWIRAEDVRLAVEVVSPESEIRDRRRKPQLYAQADIPHLWLVEQERGSLATVHVYRLDPVNRSYTHTGSHRDRLKTDTPCDLDIDLTWTPRSRRG